MKKCTTCFAVNPDENDICRNCGADISDVVENSEEQQTGYKVCPICHAVNSDKDRVCRKCNTDISEVTIIPAETETIKSGSIGDTLKTVAQVFAIIGIIFCIIGAIISGLSENFVASILCIVGAVLCPIASLPLYGFGTLITTAQSIDRKLK